LKPQHGVSLNDAPVECRMAIGSETTVLIVSEVGGSQVQARLVALIHPQPRQKEYAAEIQDTVS
jgi:hypothetical protein